MTTAAHHPERATVCHNCGMPVSANFCAHCGQETVLHVPSATEFLHEFVGHYVALEGKLWKSIGLLLFKPGRLTHDYLEGKRVRYVLPLRLYLTFSIIFFALFKLSGMQVGTLDERALTAPPAATAPAAGAPAAGSPAAGAAHAGASADRSLLRIDTDDGELGGKLIDMAPAPLKSKLARLREMPGPELMHLARTTFFSYVPYALFALMPVFALYLKLLYLGSGRRYGEHLLFALHTNAFAFLVLSLLLVIPASVPLIPKLLALWLVFYLPTAMRRVYGGTRLATFARWLVLGLLHLLSLILAILAAVGLGMVFAA